MGEEILIELKNRLEHLLARSPLPLPIEINRELNILYMLYNKNLLPQSLDKHLKAAIKITRHVNNKIFTLSAINEAFAKNLHSYLLSTARDIFAVMAVIGAKEQDKEVETTFLEEGLALLASQGAEISLLGAAHAHKKVEIEHLAYELYNDLWDSALNNKKIKNLTLKETEELASQIERIIEYMKDSSNPFLCCIGIYNMLLYTHLINLLKKIEKVIEKEE
ncbi:MAG TPA: hypothetical protein PL110_12495 [Candidatus Eremiobacteraeota bacterium]|nr:MAG: hypothetical protein BWY64_00370 [bacterium ADurb.Bin363]HPZ08930.1 hypothetical protein [Candidatus Eremiobacteraeota bacterium]